MCSTMIGLLNTMSSSVANRFTFDCMEIASNAGCIAALTANTAQLMVTDAGVMFTAFSEGSNIKPLLSENYGGQFAHEYFAVAVVKKSNGIVTFEGLRGKGACGTGYQRSTGWMAPLGLLTERGIVTAVSADPNIPNDIEVRGYVAMWLCVCVKNL